MDLSTPLYNFLNLSTLYFLEGTEFSLRSYINSAVQEISLILRSHIFCYSLHKRPPLPIDLSQINPVHFLPVYFFNI